MRQILALGPEITEERFNKSVSGTLDCNQLFHPNKNNSFTKLSNYSHCERNVGMIWFHYWKNHYFITFLNYWHGQAYNDVIGSKLALRYAVIQGSQYTANQQIICVHGNFSQNEL